jgi:hypothetical protein
VPSALGHPTSRPPSKRDPLDSLGGRRNFEPAAPTASMKKTSLLACLVALSFGVALCIQQLPQESHPEFAVTPGDVDSSRPEHIRAEMDASLVSVAGGKLTLSAPESPPERTHAADPVAAAEEEASWLDEHFEILGLSFSDLDLDSLDREAVFMVDNKLGSLGAEEIQRLMDEGEFEGMPTMTGAEARELRSAGAPDLFIPVDVDAMGRQLYPGTTSDQYVMVPHGAHPTLHELRSAKQALMASSAFRDLQAGSLARAAKSAGYDYGALEKSPSPDGHQITVFDPSGQRLAVFATGLLGTP